MFPFCGLNLDMQKKILCQLQGPFIHSKGKNCSALQKIPEFSSTADHADVTDLAKRQKQKKASRTLSLPSLLA
jgi:hypothetical protein